MKTIIEDVKKRLNIEFSESDIHIFTEGKTDAVVFSIKDEYLIKKCSKVELDTYNDFLSFYKSEYFQKLYYINYDLSYVCLSFTKGDKYNGNLDIYYLVNSFYDITSNYKTIDYDGFGYYLDDHKTWYEFLRDEIEYSKKLLIDTEVDMNIVLKALEMVKEYNVDKYLIHGDFGTHNFIVNDSKLYVIDPMGVVGDNIYDFYFAIYSDSSIYTKLNIEDILKYFDRDINYKKIIIVLMFFIRLCRTYKYDIEDFNTYLDYYNNIISNLL